MKTYNWNMGWRIVVTTCTLLVCFETFAPVSGQCFTENDNKKCGMKSTNGNPVVSGSIDFSLTLFKSVANSPSLPAPGNCHISPASVQFALIDTYLGTRGNTKAEMQTALRLGNSTQKQVLQQYRAHKSNLMHNATDTANYTVNIADRIYFDNNLKLRECMVEYLKPELEQVDFRTAPEPSRKLINVWVEDQTNKKITDLLPEGTITTLTKMVIVNAVYLKAAWNNKFQHDATSEEDFFVEPQKSKKVSMMHQVKILPYATSSQLGCTAVQLAYSGNEISMLILLPNSNVADLINKLNTDNLKDLFDKLKPEAVNLAMPKFKIIQKFEFSENLRAMGINDLFEESKADLSGFTGSKDSFVDKVHQKTYIEVNEDGTEAAAATGVVIGTTSVLMPKVEINVNRPYVFVIINNKYKSVLFIGKINDPTVEN